MLIVGWEDPAHHELGVGYGKQVKEALAPCTTVPDPYVNNIECSARECHNRGGWVQVPAARALPALAPGWLAYNPNLHWQLTPSLLQPLGLLLTCPSVILAQPRRSLPPKPPPKWAAKPTWCGCVRSRRGTTRGGCSPLPPFARLWRQERTRRRPDCWCVARAGAEG